MAQEKKQTMKKPVWLKYTEAEVKEIIFKIIEKEPNITTEKIGLILRDNYGIPKTKIYGFKISDVLKEKNIYSSPDKINIDKKLENLQKHLIKNHGDETAERSLIKTKSKFKITNEYLAS